MNRIYESIMSQPMWKVSLILVLSSILLIQSVLIFFYEIDTSIKLSLVLGVLLGGCSSSLIHLQRSAKEFNDKMSEYEEKAMSLTNVRLLNDLQFEFLDYVKKNAWHKSMTRKSFIVHSMIVQRIESLIPNPNNNNNNNETR